MSLKQISIEIVVALILVAALVVAPVAAGRTIAANGTNVFIGEENLNFMVGSDFDGATALVHYTGEVGESSIDRTLAVNAAGNITEFTKGMSTGSYYAIGSAYPDVTYVNVMEPELAADIVLNTSKKDSVAGKSVTRDTKLDFKLTNNVDIPGAVVDIEVTMPGGGVVTNFGGQSLRNIPVDGTTAYIGAVDLTGEAAGKYVVQAKWPNRFGASDFYGKGFNSAAGSFEVLTKSLAIESNKDSVVRGNSFTVTITGESKMTYDLYIKNVGGLVEGQYPWILDGQNGVTKGIFAIVPGIPGGLINATVETNAGGMRSVQFNTDQGTDNRSFTIRVENRVTPDIDYDEVKVRVDKGSVTITSSGTGTYSVGEGITLSGTCTDNNTKVHLFMTGPNLASSNGVNLLTLTAVENNNTATFNTADVKSDDSWSFKWDTGDISILGGALDSGGYTIYAVSKPLDKSRLSETEYAATSIQLQPPTLTARTSGTTLTPGNDYWIRGVATGDPDAVQIWIFGPNYYKLGVPVMVEADGSFECILTGAETSGLVKGQYYVVVQHPMMNNVLDIFEGPTPGWISGTAGSGFTPVRISGLRASDAATALIYAIDSPNIDDTYAKFFFSVDTSRIWIDGICDQTYGETFTVTGTTGYPAGTTLAYQISANEDGTNVLSDEVIVADGGGWSFEVDTTVIGPGAYSLRVTSPDGQTSMTVLFDVYDDVIHPISPVGASYRVERTSVNPSLDVLSSGDRVMLDSTIECRWPSYGGYGYLEFSTDLQDPVWSYTLEVGEPRTSVGPMTESSKSFVLSDWELGYRSGDVHVLLSLAGTVPDSGTANPALLRILERDRDSKIIPGSEYRLGFTPAGNDPTSPFDDTLTFHPGWNFVSIPRLLATGNDTASIFTPIDTAGHSALRYDTASRAWGALTPDDLLVPLEGIWVYSTGSVTVPLAFSTDLPLPPAERSLTPGWNAVGITGTASLSARDALLSASGGWTTLIGFDVGTQAFEKAVINGGSGDYTDSRPLYPGRGYWLYMTKAGNLCATGV